MCEGFFRRCKLGTARVRGRGAGGRAGEKGIISCCHARWPVSLENTGYSVTLTTFQTGALEAPRYETVHQGEERPANPFPSPMPQWFKLARWYVNSSYFFLYCTSPLSRHVLERPDTMPNSTGLVWDQAVGGAGASAGLVRYHLCSHCNPATTLRRQDSMGDCNGGQGTPLTTREISRAGGRRKPRQVYKPGLMRL